MGKTLDGDTMWDKDNSLFYGQHNPEVLSYEDEKMLIVMFDNGYDALSGGMKHDTSRVLKVMVDEKTSTITEDWFYDMGHFSYIYGDADITPEKNFLACSWPHVLTKSAAYDTQSVLVVPNDGKNGGRIGWAVRTYAPLADHGCTDFPCVRCEDDAPKGWAQYSVERFFDRPQVSHVSCGSTTLTISNVVDSFKHSFDVPGHVFVYEGNKSTVIHEEKFTFWRYNQGVEISMKNSLFKTDMDLRVEVQNKYKQSYTHGLTCA